FFFQAEDGIRDFHVTGVQTCALPIYLDHDVGFENHFFIINDLRTLFTVMKIHEIGSLTCTRLNHDLMPMLNQQSHRQRRQCHPVLLKGSLFWYADYQAMLCVTDGFCLLLSLSQCSG